MRLEKTTYQFLQELIQFDYQVPNSDCIWEVLFKTQEGQWNYLHISKYNATFFLSNIIGESGTLKVLPKEKIEVMESGTFGDYRSFFPEEELMEEWIKIMEGALKWLSFVKKDWIKTNQILLKEYPLNYRFGTIPQSLIRAFFPDNYQLDKVVGIDNAKQFTHLVESGHFMNFELGMVETMTAEKYFEYCKIAYLAGVKEEAMNPTLSGREMYQRYADGRHEGLLDIDSHSKQEFADWIDGKHPKKTSGGHPWEIRRGGSFTQINLSVRRADYTNKDKFKITLGGSATGRLAETIKMFLALYKENLPVAISEPKSIRKRLLAQDNVGIVPEYASLSRTDQHFMPEEAVFEVMYFDDLAPYQKKLSPFIRWESLPILRLQNF